MNASLRVRSATGLVALLASGPLAGCNDRERPPAVVTTLVQSSPYAGSPVGSAAAKGAELSAVATVRAWIDARNQAVRTGGSSAVDHLTARECGACDSYLNGSRWSVRSAQVLRHVVRSAAVAIQITTAESGPATRFALEFEVSRVAGESVITDIRRVR